MTPKRSLNHVVLGRSIPELRVRRVLSQEELGSHTGLHRNYVGALERGEVNPTFRTLSAVSDGLQVNLSELITLYERRRTEHLRPHYGTSRDERLRP